MEGGEIDRSDEGMMDEGKWERRPCTLHNNIVHV